MLLKLQNIGKIYNSNDILTIGIRGINLELDYNEFVTIEGESGSGKSTLLNVIGANDSYEEGELFFNGQETSHYSESDWEKYRENNIATIFQDFNIIENLTVLENVELALLRFDNPKKRKEIASSLIKKVGLTKQINQKGSKLSGGEKQRTVIARALAKDSPIILADEPTGNLDVKASKEVAKLLKDVSKDKLVIVVTHNPEFFKEYATRRIRVFDGSISEDDVISKPEVVDVKPKTKEDNSTRLHNIKNIFHLGTLNYKSRPKFTIMMSMALLVCAITLFLVISIFGTSLISPVKNNIDGIGLEGKVVVSSSNENITIAELNSIASKTNPGFVFLDKELSEFDISVPQNKNTMQDYLVKCLYSPYDYNLAKDKGVLVLPKSAEKDGEYIKNLFINANVGISSIEVKSDLYATDVRLYLSNNILKENGRRIKAINSGAKFDEVESMINTFEINAELKKGEVNLINSNYSNITGKTAIFLTNTEKAYTILNDNYKKEDFDGIIVQMNREDFEEMFKTSNDVKQSCLYFANDSVAKVAIKNMPNGYRGLLATTKIYVQNAGDVYTTNIVWYIAMIGVSLLFGVLISIIFMRSVKIFQTDFSIYKTLGIPSKIALKSLYIQMALIFLPTLVLLPLISLISSVIPGSTVPFISVSNYFFIEVMLLIIVELVAFGFNKTLNGQSIRKSLRRGSK